MKKIAVMNDISGLGRCSLTAALPIISAFGVQCCPMVTGVYANQTGYPSYYGVDMTPHLHAFFSEWKKRRVHFDAVITGFITTPEQGAILAKYLEDYGNDTLTVVDPVMADDGEVYKGFDSTRIAAVKLLASCADIITPNLHELCILADCDYNPNPTGHDLRLMSALTGVPTVITTGIKRGDSIVTAVYTGSELHTVKMPKIGDAFSGTGDIFVSYVTAAVVSGQSVLDAVHGACDFIRRAIELTLEETRSLPYHPDGVCFEKLLRIL